MGLKIAMISPFFVRCGIASYSMALSKALANLGCEIFGVRLPRFGVKTSGLLQLTVDQIPVDRVDLIHHQQEYGLMRNLEGGYFATLKRLGKPIICTCHSVGNWMVDHIIADVSSRCIVHNQYCFRRFGHPKKTVVIGHGCSPTETPPMDECKRRLGIDPRVPVVGYVGFISPAKGLESLVEAMRGVPNAALLVGGGWFTEGGETQYITRLKQWSLEVLEGRCQWLGYVPDERLATVYGSLSIEVYPSRFCTESGALLMALSHGKAVIASDLPPMREKAKLGALMTFKSVKDLRRKIKRLLKDEELRRKLEDGAKNYAKSVEWSVVAEHHVKLYEEVLSEE